MDNLQYSELALDYYDNAVSDYIRVYQLDPEDCDRIPIYLLTNEENQIIIQKIYAFLKEDRYGIYKISYEKIYELKRSYPSLSDYHIMINLKCRSVMESVLWQAIYNAIDDGNIAVTAADIVIALDILDQFNIPQREISDLKIAIIPTLEIFGNDIIWSETTTYLM